mgnify:CR=1 FL=1
MIINVDELIKMSQFQGMDSDRLKRKLDGLEKSIRSYTNNNFQNRTVRFEAKSAGNVVYGSSPFLRIGDTVQVSQSQVNDGLYTITELLDDSVRVDSELFPTPYNLVTKVEYPADVQEGVLNLMLWEVENRQKVGIKSETLSRHSVTYYDQDSNNQVMGYPVSLMGFLKPYMRARF